MLGKQWGEGYVEGRVLRFGEDKDQECVFCRDQGFVRDWVERCVEVKNLIMGDRVQKCGDSTVWGCRVKSCDIKDGHSLFNISLLRGMCVCGEGNMGS